MEEVDVANLALAVLTEAPITALDQNVSAARLLNRVFEQTRRSELTKHVWSFALLRSEVTGTDLDTGTGTLNWSYAIPTDALRILPLTYNGEPDGVPISWRRDGDVILTDQESPRIIRTVQDVPDPDDWSPLFVDVMAAALAIKVAHSITSKSGMVEIAQNAYRQAVDDALRVNALEVGALYRQGWSLARGDDRYWRA